MNVIEEHAKAALGRLHWTPDTFWRATPQEFYLAVRGLMDDDEDEKPKAMTQERFEQLMEQYPDT